MADSHKQPLSFPLTVGVIPTICPYLLPRVLPLLGERYPDAQLNIVEDQSHILVDRVRNGELDTAILALPFPCDGLLTLEFWEEDFYWVARKGEENTQREEITGDELGHCKLMLLNDGHCLKEHILEACKLPEIATGKGFGAASLNTLIQMVLGNMGTTLIPEMAMGPLISQHEELAAVHLDEPGPHRRIAFLLRPNYTRTSSIEALMDVCREALKAG